MSYNNEIPTIITKRNVDSNENCISVKILEQRQIMDNHSCVVLSQIPDELHRINIDGFTEVYNQDEVGINTFYVSYGNGVIYFHPRYNGKSILIEYYGIGYECISASRVFYKKDKTGNIIETLEEIFDKTKVQFELIEHLGDAVQIIEKLAIDIERADNLEVEIGNAINQGKKDKDDIVKQIQDNINQAKNEVINVAGNLEVLIPVSQWTLNNGVYEKQITHTLNSENVHVSAKNSDTKESVTIGYKIVDKSKILLKSDEAINMSLVLNASYYKPIVFTNVDEGEVVRARKGETSLDVKIDKIDLSLESNTSRQIEDVLNIKNPQIELSKQPILVIIDDDTRKESYDYTYRFAKENNINVCFACIPEWIETGSSTTSIPPGKPVMTLEQLKEVYNNGNDVLSHGWNSLSVKDFLNNPSELKKQLLDAREWLKNKGFIKNGMYKYYVHPQGLPGTTTEQLNVKAEVRKYYEYGVGAFQSNSNINGVFDSFNVPRFFTDGASYEQMKSQIDNIITTKGVCIFGLHGYSANGVTYENWKVKYQQAVDYCKANSVKIMTFSEMIKTRGNVLSVGEYTKSGNLYVNNDGSTSLVKTSYIQSVGRTSSLDISTLNTFIKVSYDVNEFSNGFTFYDGINNNFIIPEDGFYEITVSYIAIAPTSDTTLTGAIHRNGTLYKYVGQSFVPSGKNSDGINSSVIIKCATGDLVDLRLKANANITISGNVNTFYIQCKKIS